MVLYLRKGEIRPFHPQKTPQKNHYFNSQHQRKIRALKVSVLKKAAPCLWELISPPFCWLFDRQKMTLKMIEPRNNMKETQVKIYGGRVGGYNNVCALHCPICVLRKLWTPNSWLLYEFATSSLLSTNTTFFYKTNIPWRSPRSFTSFMKWKFLQLFWVSRKEQGLD